MPELSTSAGVQLLDLLLDFFTDDAQCAMDLGRFLGRRQPVLPCQRGQAFQYQIPVYRSVPHPCRTVPGGAM